jgi:peroxiredoxin
MPLPPRDFDNVGPKPGERFPDIRLPDQSGAMVDLHAARAGRAALVVFHRSAEW